jgi:hypothetical protein
MAVAALVLANNIPGATRRLKRFHADLSQMGPRLITPQGWMKGWAASQAGESQMDFSADK